MLRTKPAILALCAIISAWRPFGGDAAGRQSRMARTPTPAPVGIQMKNVHFRITSDIAMDVEMLRGQLDRTSSGEPVTLDNPASFLVDVDTAQLALSPTSLTSLMNTYVLAYDGAPIRNLEIKLEGGTVVEKGTIHKGIDLPFEIRGTLSATGDGNICLHAKQIKSAHIPIKGLLHLFGENLSKLINQRADRGMQIVGDDVILNLRQLTPPPHLEGRVARVDIEDGRILVFMDSARHLPRLKPPLKAAAYIYHRGGVLRFGKLTMSDADLEIVGNHTGSFDFFQRQYLRQLVAGYSRTTPSNGLVAHMLDYSSLGGHGPRSHGPSQRFHE